MAKFEAVVEQAPHYNGPVQKVVLEVGEAKVDKASVVGAVYVFYKSNFLTRHVLKKMLWDLEVAIAKPEEVFQWLVNEAAKA